MPTDELTISVMDGALSTEAKELATEWAEVSLDALLEDGLLKALPVVGTGAKLFAILRTVRDRFFVRKVLAFLTASPRYMKSEAEAFSKEHLSDPKKTQQLGDALTLILERLDDMEKPAMLAKVFASLVRGHINLDAFRRLISGIDTSNVYDLKALAGHPIIPEDFFEPYPLGLVRSGFATFKIKGVRFESTGDQAAVITNLGKLFQKCMLEN